MELEEQRELLLKELGSTVPMARLDFFQDILLPKVTQKDLKAILGELRQEGELLSNGRWRHFPHAPSHVSGTENQIFVGYELICRAIETSAEKVLKRTKLSEVLSSPNQAWVSESPNCEFKTDCDTVRSVIDEKAAYSISTDPLRPDAANVIVNKDFKVKGDGKKREDNNAKIISAASHVLFNDPRRRFTFSLSMEDTKIRFWWHSRAIVLVSEEFDIFEEPERFVYFVVSMAFGSDEEVGFDPTVRRLAPRERPNTTDKVQYKFLVDGQWYLSKECISTYKACRAIGRATRVWLVTPQEDPKRKPLVLKDVWLAADAKSEKEIQDEIFDAMGTNAPTPVEDYKKYFMTILADEIVSINGKPDIIEKELVQPFSLPNGYQGYFLFHQAPLKNKSQSVPVQAVPRRSGTIPGHMFILSESPSSKDSENRQFYEAKKHCRLLFKEYGKPLHELDNHQTLLQALVKSTTGLQCLYSAGWVHRDISSGNLLLCDDDFCKISDLEYARNYKCLREPSAVSKSGTPEFMAVEIQTDRLLFSKRKDEEKKKDYSQLLAIAKRWAGERGQIAPRPKAGAAPAGVRHNYLHDLEALFWIAMWCLYTTLPASHDTENDDLQLRLDKVKRLFPHSLHGGAYRVAFFQLGEQQYLDEMEFLPLFHRVVGAQLIVAKSCLLDSYETLEQREEDFISQDGFSNAYIPVGMAFQEAIPDAADSVMAIKLPLSQNVQPSVLEAVTIIEEEEDADAYDPPSPCAGRTTKRKRENHDDANFQATGGSSNDPVGPLGMELRPRSSKTQKRET